MSQFLCQDYEEVHFIDPRYYKMSISEYIVKNNIEEVLFLYNANSINNDTGIFTVR